jgi:amino acid adenylation domain-containing protein
MHGEAAENVPDAGIPRRSGEGPTPLSFAQQRLWFLDQFEPGSPMYNMPFAVRFTGNLDLVAVEQSLDEIVRRHEILRTVFRAENGQPVQVILPDLSVPLQIVDLREVPESERQALSRQLIARQARRPFDLTHGPLLWATLLWMGKVCLDAGRHEEHVLLLNMHHIVSDGWSTGVLVRELAALYQAFCAGEPSRRAGRKQSPLLELPIQYADFALWQRDWLRGEVLETQFAYWKRQLIPHPPVLALPADHPRPAAQTFHGALHSFVLPQDLTDKLKALSRQEGVTLFMTLLAALKTLLFRYTTQTDVAVGSPIANRSRPELEALIGFFVNTLVLRTDLSGNPTFRELLGRVHEVALGAFAHQDVPFEKLVEELRPERDLSRSPLFQLMFVLQNAPIEPLALPDLTLSPFQVDSGTARFDLLFSMAETRQGLRGDVEYNTDLFNADTIVRMLAHWQVLLEGVVAEPGTRLSDLPLLPPAERNQLAAWNDTGAAYPQDRCLHELFETQASRTPDAIAVSFASGLGQSDDEHLAYGALDRRAGQLARQLQSLGVGPDVPVAICMRRSIDMILGLLATLKAGGVYVPLDPNYPGERLTYMLDDTQTPVILTQAQLLEDLPQHQAHVICLDADWPLRAERAAQPLSQASTPDNLLYIMYTSGSTGWPKGVAMRHRPLVNLVHWQERTVSTGWPTRTLQFASLSFDVSCQEIFCTLSSGGTLILTSEDTQRDAVALLALLEQVAVERLFLPFIALQHLAQVAEKRPPQLRQVITAGEPLQITSPIADFFGQPGLCTLHNHYGPTEAHAVTAFTLQGTPEMWAALPSIGQPIANAEIHILDPHLQPSPIGVPGELYIGGRVLARGYHNRPDLSAERFVPNPPSVPPACGGEVEGGGGARLYKTGDLARYLPDGNLEFLGRIDHQVKVRGFRIELGEIEAVLGRHGAVREAVVLAREDQPGGKRLVAYVVPADDAADLRRYLKDRLPEYMLPSAFVTLEALPLTPSGKVDRRALPAPEGERPRLATAFVAPRTPVEETLAGIYAQVLGLEQVGVHDDFFDLGGHSLLATQVMSRVHNAFYVHLPLRRLFETPTVAGLAQAIDDEQQADPSPTSATMMFDSYEEERL